MAKLEGRGNVVLEDAPIPKPGPGEVRVKAVRSLISRGSEIGRRYVMEEAVAPQMMGYSMAGVVDAVGDGVDHLAVGDRVGAVGPHAQFVVGGALPGAHGLIPEIFPLTRDVTWDQAPYWILGASAVRWVDIAPFERDNVIVLMGQGLVGSLMLQVLRSIGAGRLVAIDAVPLRCEVADDLGADHVINAAQEDPVAAVRRLTNGAGAELVIYAVGGPGGPEAFQQGIEMLSRGGTLHLIGLYEHQSLPLSSQMIQGRRIIGGYFGGPWHAGSARRALALLESGAINADRMTTHRFPYMRAPEAFHLLYGHTDQTLGVLLNWDVESDSL
jgi:L-iditol 2-dehydrogenase